MSSVHCIVVWEWQSNGQWLPHTPGVTRTLERAHAKKLTRVVLADADPALRGHYVNLRTLTQCLDTSEGCTAECRVRRACYDVASAGGRGVRWEWARLVSPPHPAELNYEPMSMEMQCHLETAWCKGEDTVCVLGWSVSVVRMTARGPASVRLVRRLPQPPYPLTRSERPPPLPPQRLPLAPAAPTPPVQRPRIPQQHTGSSVQSVQSIKSVKSLQAPVNNTSTARGGARSASPRDRKPGLARQILHNLNIFSNSSKPSPSQEATPQSSGRRHSVDTVSTYLSHGSKDSLQQGSVGELLNCSAGSDDVFDPPPPRDRAITSDDDALELECEAAGILRWARVERRPQWGSVCWACLRPLQAAAAPAVALRRCRHLLHLHCLRALLPSSAAASAPPQEPLYIECQVCGEVYTDSGSTGSTNSDEGPSPAPPAPVPAPAGPRAGVGGAGVVGAGAGGAQPPGSMAWSLQATSLPPYPHVATILVTYSFQSGRQGPLHPVPGAPYYAVGFPRHTILPDTPLGRQVLSALRTVWAAGQLFGVCASQTTGREHVVSWRVPPPPARARHYPAPAPRADLLLAAALQRLHAFMDAHR